VLLPRAAAACCRAPALVGASDGELGADDDDGELGADDDDGELGADDDDGELGADDDDGELGADDDDGNEVVCRPCAPVGLERREYIEGRCSDCHRYGAVRCDEYGPLAHPDWDVKYSRWEEVTYTTKDGRELKKHDFMTVTKKVADLEQDILKATPQFLLHHDLMKWQGADLKRKRASFPRGTFGSTQDFSENGKLSPKYVHVSRYFNEIGFTLYGAVLTFHAQDLGDSAFEGVGGLSGAEAKESILEQYATEKPGEPALVTITLAVISTDLSHNPAFVQHVNGNIVTPFAKQHAAPGVAFSTHYVDSDGCPNHFDLADQYLWISGQQQRNGIRMDWTLNCPCHGKALSDPEMGAAKAKVAGEQLKHNEDEHHLIESVAEVVDFLRREFNQPDKSILDNKNRRDLAPLCFLRAVVRARISQSKNP
jgi:hypothetical protein